MQVPKQKTFSSVLMASPSDPNPHQPKRPTRDEDAGKRATCIIDTRTSENPQTRIEGKLDDLTKGVADIPSKVCDEFMKRCVESENQLVTKSKEAEELRSEVESLKEQLQQEKADSQDKVQQLQTKSSEAKALGSELQSLKEQLQQQKSDSQEKVAELTTTIQGLDEDKRKLREVILGNALRHEVSDDDIRQRFVNIRQQIQAVVNNPAYDKTRRFMPGTAENESEFRFHQQYNSYSPEDRIFLMRSRVYQILCHFVFSRDAFGLAGPVPPLQHNREAQLDQFLGDFEGLLRTKKVTNEVISDWRLATFKCVESFSAAPYDNSNARGEIRHFLIPLLISERNLLKKIGTEIDRLCDDAFALRLLTRKSGDRYHFDGPTRGEKYVPAKGTVEVCAVLGGGEVSNRVEFSICGALIKHTGNEESEVTCVLEPAHVVVQAKKSYKPSHLTRDSGRSDTR
ncbi:hypothetical protein E4U09_004027 [Claviceps aff. purpurea]|uniref:Uncharacterized protein n=1 Tax=Claviceps aff. purpurea TaxID=1967640 RepID=A0A9P7QMD1_9HYPO|nr:hypothetical protein E4U09_004027 [Claviceps aff. purpurea]